MLSFPEDKELVFEDDFPKIVQRAISAGPKRLTWNPKHYNLGQWNRATQRCKDGDIITVKMPCAFRLGITSLIRGSCRRITQIFDWQRIRELKRSRANYGITVTISGAPDIIFGSAIQTELNRKLVNRAP